MIKNNLLLISIIFSVQVMAQERLAGNGQVMAQERNTESGQAMKQERRASADSLAVAYMKEAGSFSTLYYGNQYQGYPPAKNHPYLKDVLYAKALLAYQDVVYPEVMMRLDMCRDELIVLTPDFRNVVLAPEKVEYAELHGKHIIYFQTDTLSGSPSAGYYVLLYAGQCRVMEKMSATLIDEAVPGKLQRFFDFTTKYYLYKDGIYHVIKNKKGVLKALQPYKTEMKRTISAHHLNFKKDAETFLILTVSEYERLSGR